MSDLTPDYWDQLYKSGHTAWDIGYVSHPLKTYFDQLTDKSIKILIPGAGNAYEAEYLHKSGFSETFVLDYSSESLKSFKYRYPNFPEYHLINDNFFEHIGQYDLIVEQTFFSSLYKEKRMEYAEKIFQLLKPGGKLIGLLFGHEFDFEGPPFGGTKEEYRELFGTFFNIKTLEIAHNSIKPRLGRELFLNLQK